MTKLILLIMAAVFGVSTARHILEDFRDDTMKYIATIALAFYASWKDVFLNALSFAGIEVQLPAIIEGEIALSLIKAMINLLSSGVLVPITTLYVTYRFKEWHKKNKK
jgi:hypothetical protein